MLDYTIADYCNGHCAHWSECMKRAGGKVLPPVFAAAEPGDEVAMWVSQTLALESFQACLPKCFAIEVLGAVLSLLLVIPSGSEAAGMYAQVAGAVVCALLPGI